VNAVMKAAVYDRYGPPEVIRIAEVPVPVPRDDEVLVRVHASVVGAVDSIARLGVPRQIRAYSGLRRPRIHVLGADFAGEVTSPGPDTPMTSSSTRSARVRFPTAAPFSTAVVCT
jgi:NADPH:quinone reductase-like Zn-dependent oxidoreductase